MDRTGSEQLTIRLVEQFPELDPLLAEHRRDNFGETLPHVFMGDVKRWFVKAYRAGRLADVKALADWFETEYAAAPADARNLIEVSFLYDLPWPPQPDAEGIKRLLPSRLATKLTEMQDWRPSR